MKYKMPLGPWYMMAAILGTLTARAGIKAPTIEYWIFWGGGMLLFLVLHFITWNCFRWLAARFTPGQEVTVR